VRIPFTWVDAFTDRAFAGNPAAVGVLAKPVPDDMMQALATELGVSETAFVRPVADGFSLRWFTPVTEVDLCGHATLAAAHVLGSGGPAGVDRGPIRFHTRSGVLPVRFNGPVIELDFPAEKVDACRVPEALASLGAPSFCGRSRFGLVVELADADTVRRCRPDLAAIAGLAAKMVIVTAPSDEPTSDYVLRVFAPVVGLDEDPVTGSAQCPLGPYWADRFGRTELVARQVSDRGGRLEVRVDGDRVHIGGQAVTVIAGHVELPVA
jgi:predicted PhzF superfamily epimerase YddE/YHI9